MEGIIPIKGAGRRPSQERGTAAVEFALVGLPVIWLICITFEVSLFLIMQFELENGVQEAARQVRIGTFRPGAATQADVKREICNKVHLLPNCQASINIDLRNADRFDSLGTPSVFAVGPETDGAPYPTTFNIGNRGSPGSLIATYDWRFIFPMVKYLFGNVGTNNNIRRLYGNAVYQTEQYP